MSVTNGWGMRGRVWLAGSALVVAMLPAARTEAQISNAENMERTLRLYESAVRGQSADPLADAFFPPELVMRHQQAIGLSAQQREAIVAAISAAQPRFIESQWQLEPETAALAELVRGPRVDEPALLAQMDRVLDIERQIKRIQVEMLVRIKNELTQEQQEQLARLGGRRLMGYLGIEGSLPGMYGLGSGASDFFEYSAPTIVSPRPPGE